MRYFCLIVILLFLIGCNRTGRLETHRWEKVNTEVDSLMLTLEKSFLGAPDHDSIGRVLKQLDSMANSSDPTPDLQRQLKARYHYWNAKLAARENRVGEAQKDVNKALSLTDSAKYPYLLWKLKYETEKNRIDMQPADAYSLIKAYDFFKKINDKPMQANTLLMMGNLFNTAHDPEMALEYLSKADSIYEELGYKEYRLKNRLNMASSLSWIGQKDSALTILHQLERDTSARKDFYFYNTVLRNIYSEYRDISYLKAARDHLGCGPDQPDLRILYSSLLGYEYLGMPEKRDSAFMLIDYSMEKIDSLPSARFKSGVAWAASEKYRFTERFDSAYMWYRYFVALTDSVEAQNMAGKAASAHYFHALNRVREEKQRERLWLIILLCIAVVGGVTGVFLLYINWMRKKQKYRLKLEQERIRSVNAELERERSNRHLMALSLAKEESERIIGAVKEKVDDLVKEGKVEKSQLTDIKAELRNYVFQRSDWDTFEKAFRSANPEFVPNLYKRCQKLSPMQVKLASLTLLGMTIKEIASYLNIKEDSVMQARWRLRNKLGLDSEESIESFLHSLNTPSLPSSPV